VVQAAEHGLRNDLPILRFSVWRLDRAWSALTDGAMRTPAIEILLSLPFIRFGRTRGAIHRRAART